MTITIQPDGTARCLYDETISLDALGAATITRASHVEPDAQGQWTADMSPVAGPMLGPFPTRSMALAAEADWLEANRIA
jgi:hypothetical protein